MLSYAKPIKTFSPLRQAIAKRKISEIISDLEIEKINENDQKNLFESYQQIPSHSQDPEPYPYSRSCSSGY
ncbi:HTH CENPB-type domain-containing protein [Aphis craccivora]|uniref:HTH CENPB-type domain-containing protein n=1 Tax=Aphis craccivora TaxID=307492 RepID=A0A6G0ZEA5_APHCR|nr:HTH CENPB-type domain-containing protein [Aphis craccivora]